MLSQEKRFLRLALVIGLAIVGVSISSNDCAAQGTATAADTALRWKFTKGQKYQIEMQQDMIQNMVMQNQPMKTANKTTTYMTWTVVDLDDSGNASIESVIDRMTMSLDTAMGKFDIDTNEDKDPPGLGAQIGASIRPMVGVTFKQKMDTRGKISDVVIPEGALAGLQQNQMGMGMSADQLSEMTKNVSPVFPEDGLEIGETWQQTSQSKTPVGAITVDNTYKYEGTTTVDDRLVHRIGIDTAMQFPAEPNEMGILIKVTDQKTNGTLYFDQQGGRILRSEVEQDMKMNVKAAGHEITQELKQKMTAKFREAS